MALYVIGRFILPLSISWQGRLALSLVAAVVLEHHWLVSQFAGTIPSPEVPREVIILLGVGYASLLFLVMAGVARDLLGLATLLVSRSAGTAVLRSQRAAAIFIVASVVASSLGVWNAIRQPQVNQLEVQIDRLPLNFDGYRIVHLTDLHASRLLQRRWLDDVVLATNALHPDLVLISGDLIDGTTEARKGEYPAFGLLHAQDGVMAVPGNHEYYVDYSPWMAVFAELGIDMLMNEHRVISRGTQKLVVAGVVDEVGLRYGLPGPDVDKALAGVDAGQAVILMDHKPGAARVNAAKGVDLQLSGHTHGGHARGLDLLIGMANDGFVSGRYQVGNMTLYTSNGAGLWPGFPIRLGRPAEVTLITLRSGLSQI